MPWLMTVAMTADQVLAQQKTVTRRLGWSFARPGDLLTLCRKVQGRRLGEPIVRLAEVELVDVRREPLSAITPEDVVREGFPFWTPAMFVRFFTEFTGIEPDDDVTRLEWRYVRVYE